MIWDNPATRVKLSYRQIPTQDPNAYGHQYIRCSGDIEIRDSYCYHNYSTSSPSFPMIFFRESMSGISRIWLGALKS